jgi:glycosyltransferase involved in cell wall biosynthesis
MRIGIDASRAFGSQRTGTENYSYQMIKHLLALPEANNHEWVLYTRENIRLPFLWTQLGLAVRTWTDRLDVLWIPAHTLPVLRRPSLRTVVTIHGIEYEYLPAFENRLQRWYLPLSTSYAVHNASKIIAVSQFTADQIKQRLGGDPQRIAVVHEGWSMDSQATTKDTKSFLKKYDLKPKGYILFVGTIQPRKNIKRLIEAYTSLRNDNIELVLVGKLGWNYEDLPIDKDPKIKFLRYINDAERDIVIQNALVYVQPSITEGFGLPILEAFNAGVPVVSSNGGALPEVVGDAGLLFDPLNIEDMGIKLAKVVGSAQLRNDLIAKGKHQLSHFSWEKAAIMTYKILTENC